MIENMKVRRFKEEDAQEVRNLIVRNVEGIMAPDGEEQDAYILGVDEAIEKFTGKIIAIIHRNDDVEEKWVVAPEGMTFTKEEIREQIHFQEQYFDSEIVM